MRFSKNTSLWLRLLCILASCVGLGFLFHRIQARALIATFNHIQWDWFLAAIAVFGALFIPAAIRWRLALKANGKQIGTGTAFRISLIGHFFYTILFGAAGGDTAKSALFSRWNRVPLTHTLAASSLDRLMGMIGLVAFMGVAFGFAASRGAFEQLGSISLRWPIWWLLIAFVSGAAIFLWLKRSSSESPQKRFLSALSSSGSTLIKTRADFITGIVCGIAVQAALSGVLAFSLAAICPEPIPWFKLAWTFPVISIISALPITFAGLGVRDGAALVLFGLYNVPSSNAMAASLLTAAVSLIWAVAGAGLLWREAARNEPSFHLKNFAATVSR